MAKNGIGTHCTTIAQDNGQTVITYHSTQIVKYDDQSIVLNSGGYQTVTTKRRMNEVASTLGLGFRVYQENFDWFVVYGGRVYPFQDRMTLDQQTKQAYTYHGEEITPIAQLRDGLGIVRWEKLKQIAASTQLNRVDKKGRS